MNIIELLTTGVGGFGLGILKNILSKSFDTVKDICIARSNNVSEEKIKNAELETQKIISSATNANLLIELEKEKIGAIYGGRADEKFVNQVNQIYRADISALKNQLGRELTDDELNSIYTNAYNRVGSVSGRGPASTGTSNKGIGFSDFMSKK
jgi:acyl carrier protein